MMKRMVIAKVVFLVGFIWLVLTFVMLASVAGSVMRGHSRDLESTRQYSDEEVHAIIYATGNDIVQGMPWLVVPPHLLMLGAFLLLIYSKRETQQQDRAATQESAPGAAR